MARSALYPSSSSDGDTPAQIRQTAARGKLAQDLVPVLVEVLGPDLARLQVRAGQIVTAALDDDEWWGALVRMLARTNPARAGYNRLPSISTRMLAAAMLEVYADGLAAGADS
jgi:hypothetical protein